MLKNLQNHIVLWIQSRTGLSGGFLISLAVAGCAALLAFIFLSVTGYVWLCIQLGPVFGGLTTAGVFLLIAVVGAVASALARDGIRQLAILERAARAQRATALFDPRVLSVAMQAGRALGWQRLIPLALLGILATQWVKEARREDATRAD
jgi:hypothetical protein